MKHEQHFSLFLKGFQLTEIVSDLKSGPLPEIVFLNQHKLSFFISHQSTSNQAPDGKLLSHFQSSFIKQQ